MTALQTWHQIVETNDFAALEQLLAEDAVFYSPIVHTPQRGRAVVLMYLSAAAGLLLNGSFRYLQETHGERSAILEFITEVEGIQINGVDMITWNDQQQITEFKVMVRPLKAVNLLHAKMMQLLQALGPA